MEHHKESNETDRLLAGKVLSGDTNAFSVIIKNTEGLVTQIVFKMIANSEDRKDIVQDIYLKAFQKLTSFEFQSKLSTWIGQIAYDESISLDALSNKLNPLNNDVEKKLFQKELSVILKNETEKLMPLYKTLVMH